MNRKIRLEGLQRIYNALGLQPDKPQIDLYIEETSHFTDEAFAAACRRVSLEARFFPKLSEFAEICRDERKRSADSDPRSWRNCRHCDDSGFVIEECPGGDARSCGRPSTGRFEAGARWAACQGPHTYARRCGHTSAVESRSV